MSKPYKSFITKNCINSTNLYFYFLLLHLFTYLHILHAASPTPYVPTSTLHSTNLYYLQTAPIVILCLYYNHTVHSIQVTCSKSTSMCTLLPQRNTNTRHSSTYLFSYVLSAPRHNYRTPTLVLTRVFCLHSPNISISHITKLLKIRSLSGRTDVWLECDYGF